MKPNHKAIGKLGMLSKAVMPHCNINHRAVAIISRLRSVHIPHATDWGPVLQKTLWKVAHMPTKNSAIWIKDNQMHRKQLF